MVLSREQMFDRILASDSSYNGVFFTGVLTTGIYCLPSCKARKPKLENVKFFDSVDAARKAGLRACKKCHPDAFVDGIDPEGTHIESIITEIRQSPGGCMGLLEFASKLGVGQSTLYKLVKKHYHTTPGEFLMRSRVEAAKIQLLKTHRPITEVAFDVGFESLSTFYEHFSRLVGMAPSLYRKLLDNTEFSVELPDNFCPKALLGYFGRDPLSLTERVQDNIIDLGIQLAGGAVRLHLEFGASVVTCQLSGGSAVEAHAVVCRMIGLDQDPAGFHLVADRAYPGWLPHRDIGLRIPMTPTCFDGVIWAILGQQVNLSFAYALRRRLVNLAGTKIDESLWAPPRPEDIAILSTDDLLPLQFSLRKAEYLIGTSKLITQGKLELETFTRRSAVAVEKELMAIRGFGPWSTNYLMMRSLGFADCVPVGDTGLTSGLQKSLKLEERPDAKKTIELMEPFAPFRSLATLHLWQSLHFES